MKNLKLTDSPVSPSTAAANTSFYAFPDITSALKETQ